ncbi:Nn.00g013510.m01.CDS01 [Neocucurbitaria sp. VM-36]
MDPSAAAVSSSDSISVPASETPSSAVSSTPAPSTSLVSSSSSEVVQSSTAATSSAFSASSTTAPEASSTLFSSVASSSTSSAAITTQPPSSTVPTPSSCTPTIIDGGFDNFSYPPDATSTLGYGTSDDWSYTRSFFETDGGWFANGGFGPAYSGTVSTSVYTAYTNNTNDIFYDIKYKHPISLCAGTSYDVSGWMRIHRRNSQYSEGCRVTAFLNGQQAFTDRLGYYDQSYRYVHGTITPSGSVSGAELYFRVYCRAPQVPTLSAPRGIKLDSVTVVPVSQWTLPAAAVLATRTTSVRDDTTATSIFPFPTPCQPTDITVPRTGCPLFDEQLEDGGFEVCSYNHWSYLEAGTTNYDFDNPLDQQLTSVVSDAHTGQSSLRVVFNSTGGSIGIYPRQVLGCVERSYTYSYWAKQAGSGCTVQLYWRSVNMGTFSPPVGSWGEFSGRSDLAPTGTMLFGGLLEVRVTCAAGGLENAVWLDDVSFQQVPWNGQVSTG